jgi:hypothetical protein
MARIPARRAKEGDERVGHVTPRRGYFSLLRWISDRTRDEARNVGIMLVDPESGFRGLRSAPVSAVSPRLHDQGLLDEMIVQLEGNLQSSDRPGVDLLTDLHRSLTQSLVVSEPKPVAITDVEEDFQALYRAYLATRGGGGRALTKGVVLDRVISAMRESGRQVKRGAYIEDFIFDVVVEDPGEPRSVIEVLSFAAPRKDWTPIEHDAGHFLYAANELEVAPSAVIQPPENGTADAAHESYERVVRWLTRARIPHRTLEDLKQEQLTLA